MSTVGVRRDRTPQRLITASVALLGLAVAAGCAHGPGGAGDRGEIVWSGEVRVEGLVTIPAGRTLRIEPGTRVVFGFVDTDGDGRGEAGIEAFGAVYAQGTQEQPIRFTGARDGVAAWGEVRVEEAPAAAFAWCEFSGAQWGLHVHRTPLVVTGSRFEGNGGGLRFRGGPVTVAHSSFRGNGIGIRFWESDPQILGNSFAGNATAVFVREGSAGSLVAGNDFLGSVDYHLKLGEGQAHDVEAPGNWWGAADAAAVERMIYDREEAPYLGRVLWRPAAPGPRRGGP